MDRVPLTLLAGQPADVAPERATTLAWFTVALIFMAAGLATLVGVDPVRRPVSARDVARRTAEMEQDLGSADERVRNAALELRRAIGARPLDAMARAVYADLLFGLSRQLEDTTAAAAHAARAAELAPVTVPVIRLAATVLAKSGRPQSAVDLTRSMFGYDPRAAGELLARIEPLLDSQGLVAALPQDPAAWLAWSEELRRAGRDAEAAAWARQTHERWPTHTPALRAVAAEAFHARDLERLAVLLPPDRTLEETPDGAVIRAYRARARAEHGDTDGARADVREALRIDAKSTAVRLVSGDVHDALGDHDEARRHWTRALHGLAPGETVARLRLLARLARYEERYGEPAAARRLWQSILAIDPQHAEARSFVDRHR